MKVKKTLNQKKDIDSKGIKLLLKLLTADLLLPDIISDALTNINGDRPDVPNVAIVITDGKSSHTQPVDAWPSGVIFRDPARDAEVGTHKHMPSSELIEMY